MTDKTRADIVLKITDGVQSVIANDHLTPGLVSFSGPIGNFTLSADIGVGFPNIGSPSNPVLDLTSLDLTTGTAGGTLTISLTETDFATTKAGIYLFWSSLVGNYINSSAQMAAYLDTGDVHFGTGTLLSTGLVDNQAAWASVPLGTGPYALTEIITVSAGPHSLASIDAAIIQAPEPTSLTLLGAGLLGLFGAGTFVRRRTASAVAA